MRAAILISFFIVTSCTSQRNVVSSADEPATARQNAPGFVEPAFGTAVEPGSDEAPGAPNLKKALFAGGCFWCMEPPFDEVDGVVATVSGYTGGPELAPQYKQVAGGQTGHTEAILIVYDPQKTDYPTLLDVFWRSHDPTDAGGQFVDRGSQYRPGIFTYDETQKSAAIGSRDALAASGRFSNPIVVEIADAAVFWPAEEVHQDFYKKYPNHYKRYSNGSGRVQFLERTWKE